MSEGGDNSLCEQHDDDQDDRHNRDVVQARIRNVKRVRGERRRAADIDLESGRRGVLRDEVTNGVNGLIRLNLADIACKTQKYVRGLAVDALRSGGGDR